MFEAKEQVLELAVMQKSAKVPPNPPPGDHTHSPDLYIPVSPLRPQKQTIFTNKQNKQYSLIPGSNILMLDKNGGWNLAILRRL